MSTGSSNSTILMMLTHCSLFLHNQTLLYLHPFYAASLQYEFACFVGIFVFLEFNEILYSESLRAET